MRASLRVVAVLAGALLALHALAQPTPDAEGALPDMPAARAPSAAELGVQTVEIPRAVMKDAEDAPQTLTAYWVKPGITPAGKAPAAGLPVVIALHGCSGLYTQAGTDAKVLGTRYRGYAQWLGARGYAVVLPDSLARAANRTASVPSGLRHAISTVPCVAQTFWRRCAG